MKPFSCQFPGCNSSYQRKEHLHRHLVQHTAETQKSPCPFCDRAFARHDTMRRHARQAHGTEAKRLCDVRAERTCNSSSNDPVSDNTSSIHRYTQRYFQYFHPQWPFLHPSSYSVRDEPSLLLYSVMAIGLWTDGEPSSRTTACALHDKIGTCIYEQQGQWDGTTMHNNQTDHTASAWPIATYQGILLYLILALERHQQCSLSQSDYGILVALVRTCRRHNLFFYPRMVGRYHDSIDSTMCIWVGMEEIKRFGIALFRLCKICSNSSSNSNVDGSGPVEADLLTLSDLRFPMPDSNQLWNAESDMILSWRLAEVEPDAMLDGRWEKNWISNLGRVMDIDCLMT